MRAHLQLPLGVGIPIGLGIIVVCIPLACGVGGEPNEWHPFAELSRLERLRAEGEEIDALLTTAKRSQEAKDRVLEDLIAHRLTLIQAAAGVRAVYRANHGKDLPESWLLHPGRTDEDPPGSYEECLCRNVIGCAEAYAELSLRQTADQVAALRARLEGELRDHLNRHGGVQLPAFRQD